MRNTHKAIVFAAAFGLGACSLLLDGNKDQCSGNGDCATFGAGYTCSAGLCKAPGDGSSSGNGSSGGSSGNDPDASSSSGDAGCVPTPKTRNADFYNEKCTNSSCVPFDNCARIGLCDGGALPALISPPDGGV